jgi:hypothetical protein
VNVAGNCQENFVREGSDTPKRALVWIVVGAALRRDGSSESRHKAAPTVCLQCPGACSGVSYFDWFGRPGLIPLFDLRWAESEAEEHFLQPFLAPGAGLAANRA